ncbi:IclR family transcriptional regulator [Fodinicola feengrottensis]|uniref:IclR family transcriptional regulator n=1 Tax=Fodinicola feengrottensis TaxID=435914 RepID=A0ABN2H6J5_9ACTN
MGQTTSGTATSGIAGNGSAPANADGTGRSVGRSIASGVGVLDKAVAILAATVDGASLAELVDRSGLPRATAHRLAQALEVHRLLIRDAQGRWRPGPRLGELANSAPDVLLNAAGPVLTALRDATGESAQLYLRRAEERICVAAAERSSGLRDTVPVGAGLPMTAGSAAQILLAWEPPESVLPLLPRARFSGRTLAEVRRRGWAATAGEREPGVASVSAPIRDRGGRVIAAVSISGPIERLGRRPGDRHAVSVVRAGHRLSGL